MLQNHYLDDLFNPDSVAIIGASTRPGSVGAKVLQNMIDSKFPGKLYPVNLKHKSVHDLKCVASVRDIEEKIDLAVITTPARTVPGIIQECGEKGIRCAVIISAGFSELGDEGKELERQILEIARRYNLHFIGPNCLGIMRPKSHVNATFDNNYAAAGGIALVSQSGAICAGILDWAVDKDIGFSSIISMGNCIDLDFGDVLEYLALDPETKSILLYIEGVHYPRRFLSGLRAAARVKPVIALKAGRNDSGARAVHSHTGALVGDDMVFTAALSRGGAVRVNSIEQLFTAAEVLSSDYRAKGDRLLIITNGGGAGVMAADHATELALSLPSPSEKTMKELNKILPPQWSHQNPVDILGDATPERYRATIEAGFKDENNDGVLTILVPIAMTHPHKVAREICEFAQHIHKPLLTCWMGEKQVKSSRKLFSDKKIPCYSTPEEAVEAFSYLANYHKSQQLLVQVPPPLMPETRFDVRGAELIINAALAEQRKILTTMESKAILSAFSIPVSQTLETHSPSEALLAAESVGFPVVMKISSPDITHKQDVGGVKLNLKDGESVRMAFDRMLKKVKARKPDAKISGITVEHMYKNPNYRELMIGVVRDKVFGPVIAFGMGGSLVEVIQDRAIALPPLNSFLAQELIKKTKAMKLLGEFRGKPAVNKDALINILMRVSSMLCELPQIQEMDINPLLVDENGAIAVDARFVVDVSNAKRENYGHMSIHPYPASLEQEWQSADGDTILIRPIRPEDARAEQAFIAKLSSAAKYFRFMHAVSELTLEMLVKFTQVDYEREMAFVAVVQEGKKDEMIIAIARYFTQADEESCEFAIVVADNWQGKGLGTKLMQALIAVARVKGIKKMIGNILASNNNMLDMVKNMQFTVRRGDDPSIKLVEKDLQ